MIKKGTTLLFVCLIFFAINFLLVSNVSGGNISVHVVKGCLYVDGEPASDDFKISLVFDDEIEYGTVFSNCSDEGFNYNIGFKNHEFQEGFFQIDHEGDIYYPAFNKSVLFSSFDNYYIDLYVNFNEGNISDDNDIFNQSDSEKEDVVEDSSNDNDEDVDGKFYDKKDDSSEDEEEYYFLTVDGKASVGKEVGEKVSFSASVSDGEPPFSWFWSFGDNSTSLSSSPDHVYQKAGNFSVTVRVTDSNGVYSRDSFMLRILEKEKDNMNDGKGFFESISDFFGGIADWFGGLGFGGENVRFLPIVIFGIVLVVVETFLVVFIKKKGFFKI